MDGNGTESAEQNRRDEEPTANPVIEKSGDLEMAQLSEIEDRPTIIERALHEDDEQCIRSVPDVLLLLNPSASTYVYAFGITFLQLLLSCMVFYSSVKTKLVGHCDLANGISYIGAGLGIACAINQSAVEFWNNNRCLENMKKAHPSMKSLKLKDNLITLAFISYVALTLATVVSVARQEDPIGIVTNCTGLLLIEQLDKGLFSILKVHSEASHLVKAALKQVKSDKRYSPIHIFFVSWVIISLSTLVVSSSYTP